MFNQKVALPQQFPVTQKNRKSTDIFCTFIGAIFALTMFITACCLSNSNNYNKTSRPTDSAGNICGISYPSRQNLYFNNDNLETRACVMSCPKLSYKVDSLIGDFCLPINQTIRNKLLDNPQLSYAWDWYNMRNSLLWGIVISITFGILWMLMVHCFPKIIPFVVVIGSIVFLLIVGIFLLIDKQSYWQHNLSLRIFGSSICLVLMIIMIILVFMYAKQLQFQGIFLQYSTTFINWNPLTFISLPIYLILIGSFLILMTWQHKCFSSTQIYRNKGSLYYRSTLTNFWAILNILELIWGLQFLKDSFHFCISGCAVDWYWTAKESSSLVISRLFYKNWGSIVGGSFLNAFLQIPTLIIQLIICHPQGCCSRFGTFFYNSGSYFTTLFSLVRTDAYSYIHLSGIPYCNSARQCQKLCDNSNHFLGKFSPIKHYRLNAHIFCVSVLFLISYCILKHKTWNFQFWALGALIIVVYSFVTLFINIHSDSAQGLLLCFLAEYELKGQYPYMFKCLPSIRLQVQEIDKKNQKDGYCQ